jgi:putative aldouronate transport system permease protein
MTDLLVSPEAPAGQDPPPAVRLKPKRRTWQQAIRRDWQLYSLVVLPRG